MPTHDTRACDGCGAAFAPRKKTARFCSPTCYHARHSRRPEADRFWSKVNVRGPGECWLWTRGVERNGYGRFGREDGTVNRTHRVAWELTHGVIPEGLWVLHSCDVRHCCNPYHLRLGTHTDNVADMVMRGRQATGDRHGSRRKKRGSI